MRGKFWVWVISWLVLLLVACSGQRVGVSGGVDAGSDTGVPGLLCNDDRDCPAANICGFLPTCTYCSVDTIKGCKDPARPCGRCFSVHPCLSSERCGPHGFCHRGDGCDRPGTCRPYPTYGSCYKIYAPVCGCDGKDYSGQCNALSKGVTPRAKGKCLWAGKTCTDLETAYDKLIQDARKCSADADCSHEVQAHLGCPCADTTLIVASKLDQKARDDLLAAWVGLHCGVRQCPCNKPTGATCKAGVCTDKF